MHVHLLKMLYFTSFAFDQTWFDLIIVLLNILKAIISSLRLFGSWFIILIFFAFLNSKQITEFVNEKNKWTVIITSQKYTKKYLNILYSFGLGLFLPLFGGLISYGILSGLFGGSTKQSNTSIRTGLFGCLWSLNNQLTK